jgi:hypothetical protein
MLYETLGERLMRAVALILPAIVMLSAANVATAEPTEIVVRVMAKDAKFIGTETGGVKITLRDADTGEVLAKGLTEGPTGNTARIMKDSHARRDVLSDDTSAKFSATLDLKRPRRVQVTALGPMMSKDAAVSVTSTQWVLPGKPVNGGDGWVLELPGFAISLLDPLPASATLGSGGTRIPLKAKVTMQCGCPITPGGQWDANKFQISAMLERGTTIYPATPLAYAGQASTFAGEVAVAEKGAYVLDIYAYDPANGNTGLVKYKLNVR